ncbi:hypothetical protein WJU23_07245 [Prosthecobacter sp. SYSU 5D2]|uniref:hypothetical protein n=1 Tax=Prosthecobacter sp. SYSU 5D2 TaxID=3134134 RepID=UPI0031FE4B4B
MDHLLFALIRLMIWPYSAWKTSLENSRVGISPSERDTLRFWKRFAIFGTLFILLAVAGLVALVIFNA